MPVHAISCISWEIDGPCNGSATRVFFSGSGPCNGSATRVFFFFSGSGPSIAAGYPIISHQSAGAQFSRILRPPFTGGITDRPVTVSHAWQSLWSNITTFCSSAFATCKPRTRRTTVAPCPATISSTQHSLQNNATWYSDASATGQLQARWSSSSTAAACALSSSAAPQDAPAICHPHGPPPAAAAPCHPRGSSGRAVCHGQPKAGVSAARRRASLHDSSSRLGSPTSAAVSARLKLSHPDVLCSTWSAYGPRLDAEPRPHGCPAPAAGIVSEHGLGRRQQHLSRSGGARKPAARRRRSAACRPQPSRLGTVTAAEQQPVHAGQVRRGA